MYTIVISSSAKKDFRKIPVSYRLRLESEILALAINPYAGKKLQGNFEGQYSLRIWPYRILYTIQKNVLTVIVLAVRHRQGVYK